MVHCDSPKGGMPCNVKSCDYKNQHGICDALMFPVTERGRTTEELGGVTHLGEKKTNYSKDYDPDVLETFVNKHQDRDYMVTFDAYEFTSLCPKTGQPDFAKLYISYIPNERMVESKSLKLYLFSFRNHGDFHEDCMNIVCDDLSSLMLPKYLEVLGIFTPRGGIAIYPFVTYVQPGSGYERYAKDRMFQVASEMRRMER